jgi:adenylate cyclase
VRMGINTGFCNVGNFGSNDRMDYTIIGAEANLALRLQSIAEGGKIVISYETLPWGRTWWRPARCRPSP